MFEEAKIIVRKLKEHGFECFAVGGCVRDLLMNKAAKDIDLATNASMESLLRLFSSSPFRILPTGIKHGTLTIVFENFLFEITSFRGEGRYEDSIKRDFTMNAIYLDLETGDLYDPHRGKEAIENKEIIFVLDPSQRIDEDPLRVFRALRFMSTLGFSLQKRSDEAAQRNLLSSAKMVSCERMRDELFKILSGAYLSEGILKRIVQAIFPSLDTYNSTLLLGIPKEKILLRLSVLFLQKSQLLKSELARLKLSNKEQKYISFIVSKFCLYEKNLSLKEARRLKYEAHATFLEDGDSVLKDLLTLLPVFESSVQAELEARHVLYQVPLTGQELMKLAEVEEGQVVGVLKDFLLERVFEGVLKADDKKGAKNLVLAYLQKQKPLK